ncbi:MAG: Gfo/Idh/MocA family oxidoreductase [Clostridiaceae bacterium]|nr:Gfo/Idh/MocA family oxidoreductase [Clostridiaceae bacterium]
MEKIRLGVVGCGGMTNFHLKGLLEVSNEISVTATCDIIPEKAKAAAEVVGAEIHATDYKKILDYVDAVLISLPHDLHFETGMFFLNGGKHVLMEKPMCNTEDECIKLIERSEENKKVLMTAYPVRYWPIIMKMKELADAKTYGEVFQMSIWTEQFTKYPEGHWALSAKRLGGGQFFSHGCHYIDLLLWFLGKPVRGVHMGTNYGTPWMEKEGTSNAIIEFENGAIGYHFGTWGARGTKLGYSFHLHCTEGMLEYNNADGKLYLHSHIKAEKANLDTSSITQVLAEKNDQTKETQFEILHFIDCIRTGKRPLTDGPRSLQGLRVIWCLYEAEQNNKIADLRGLGLDEDWRNISK